MQGRLTRQLAEEGVAGVPRMRRYAGVGVHGVTRAGCGADGFVLRMVAGLKLGTMFRAAQRAGAGAARARLEAGEDVGEKRGGGKG